MSHRRNNSWLLMASVLLLAACGRSEPDAVAAPAATPTAAASPTTAPGRATSFAQLIAGTDYQRIEPSPPASPANMPIEVAEAFSYACSHCAHFEPQLSAWAGKLPPDVSFEAVPMPLSDVWTEFARAHYAAADLGLSGRTHAALFEAIHAQGARIDSVDALVQWFVDKGGVDAAAFRSAMTSPGTDMRIEGARARAQRWGVDSTPTLVIDDRYRVLGFADSEGGFARTLAVADLLIQEVRRSRMPAN